MLCNRSIASLKRKRKRGNIDDDDSDTTQAGRLAVLNSRAWGEDLLGQRAIKSSSSEKAWAVDTKTPAFLILHQLVLVVVVNDGLAFEMRRRFVREIVLY